MSMGNKMPPGMFNNQGFTGGYTPPYGGGYGGGAYDPMLGFGQTSGMGTIYPSRYSADYTRYAQSGMPFNQPVMGYNTYGQIFNQPSRQAPPIMGGGKGGMGGFGGFRPQPPPMMGGGKGGVQSGYGGFQQGFGGFQPRFGGFQQGFGQFASPRGGMNRQRISEEIRQPVPRPTSPSADLQQQTQFNPALNGGNISPPVPGVGPPPRELSNPDLRPRFPPPSIDPGANNGGASVDLGGTSSSPAQATGRTAGQNAYNPAFQQQQQLLAQRQRTGRAGNLEQSATRENVGEVLGLAPGAAPYNPVTYDNSNVIRGYQSSGFNESIPSISRRSSPVSESATRENVGEVLGLAPGAAPYNPVTYDDSNVIRGYTSSNFNETMPSLGGGFGLINPGFGTMQFQEGGQVPPDAASNMEMMLSEMGPANPQTEMAGEYDRLIQMTMQAVLGQTENADEIIKMFIDEFGVDAFRQLRDAVLKQQVPNAQTEGMVDGNGGGMDDQVMGMIGNQRPVAVSPGEYIVPADVVSGLGDGSSKSGADILDELNQAVRMARTGTTQQPRPLMETMK